MQKEQVDIASIGSGTKQEGQTVGHLYIYGHRYTWTLSHTHQAWTCQAPRGTAKPQNPDIKINIYPAVERDSSHPGLGMPRGQGWCLCWVTLCRMTKGVRHRYPRYSRKTPRSSTEGEADTASLVLLTVFQSGVSWLEGAGFKEPLEKQERTLGGAGGMRS